MCNMINVFNVVNVVNVVFSFFLLILRCAHLLFAVLYSVCLRLVQSMDESKMRSKAVLSEELTRWYSKYSMTT